MKRITQELSAESFWYKTATGIRRRKLEGITNKRFTKSDAALGPARASNHQSNILTFSPG